MKTKISSRALRVTLLALVLGMILAVTSFAALSIEDGKLVGKEEGTYTAQQVTSIKNTGNALVYDSTVVTLDGTENLTAGLWKVTCPDNTSIILYSEGAISDRRALGVIASGTKLSVSNSVGQFVVGAWTTPDNNTSNSTATNKTLYNYAENNFGLRPRSTASHLAAGTAGNELGKLYTAQTNYKSNPSAANEEALLAAQTTIIDKFNSTYYTQYAYEPSEMMPANQVLSFTYKMGFYSSNTYFYYSGDDVSTKAVLYVTDKDGKISTYTWTVKREDGFLKNNSKDNKQSVTIDFTVPDDDGNSLPADKFVVGMEIHPYTGMEKGKTEPGLATTNVTSATTKKYWTTIFYPDPAGYEIYVKPVDISKLVYADGTVTVPKDNFGSVYQYAQVNGISADGEGLSYGEFTDMTLSGDNYTKTDFTAGLWAIKGKSNSADLVDSDPVLIYVAGSPNDRKNLGTYSSGNTLKTTTKINEFLPGLWTGPDGNAKNNSSSNVSWSSMWDVADGDFAIRGSSAYSHFSANSQYLSRHDGALVTLYNAQTAYELDNSEANKTALLAAQAAIIERLNTRYYAVYSYAADEIIPANEVLGFTYNVSHFSTNTGLAYTGDDVKSKAVIYTTDKNGNITEYTWIIDLDSFLEAKSGAIKTISFDFTAPNEEGKALPADEYVVAMELHPFIGMEKGNTTVGTVKATAEGTSWVTKLIVDPAGYDIYVEKVVLPELTVEGDSITFTGGEDGASYVYAKVNSINDNGTKLSYADFTEFTANENTYSVTGLEVGLWAVKAVSNDIRYADSDIVLVYIEGDSFVRKDIGTVSAGTKLAISTDKVFVSGKWTGPEESLWNYSDGDYSLRPTSSSIHLKGETFLQNIVDKKAAYDTALASGDDTAIAEAKTALLKVNTAAVNRIKDVLYVQYAYTPDEFVPADQFMNFTYKLTNYSANNNFYYVGNDIKTKIIVYVTDKNGNVTEYTWTQSKGDEFLGYGKPALTSQSTTFDFTTPDDEGKTLSADQYVVAMRVYPYVGMEKAETDVNAVMARIVDSTTPNWTLVFFANPADYGIKVRATAPELKSFPALVEDGNGEISGLDADIVYEIRVKGETAWEEVPAGTTHFATTPGTYEVRVKEAGTLLASDVVEITVGLSTGFESVRNEVRTFYLASDFVEVQADYEIEVGSKGWISSLALENIKTVSPDSNVIIIGEGYKVEVTASDIETDKAVHYYNLLITFDGESRHDTDCDKYKELAGDEYVTNYFVESVDGLPFADGTISIYLGEEFNGLTVQLKKYNNIAGRLTREESTTVTDGWVKFTLIEEPGVITCDEM